MSGMTGLSSPLRFQDGILQGLRARLVDGILPHAFLFAGPAGCGKSSLTRWFAQALLCGAAPELAPCGSCASCRVFDAGNHGDLQCVALDREAGEYVIKVEVVQELIERLALRPHMGRRRVAWIEGAESLNEPAQNCLLKTLEEPRPGTFLLLTARQPEALLPTILSRVQRYRLRALLPEEVASVLDDLGVRDSDARALVLDWCQGSAGMALELLAADPQGLLQDALGLLQDPAAVDPVAAAQRWLTLPEDEKRGRRSQTVELARRRLALLPRVARARLGRMLAAGSSGGYHPGWFERLDLLAEECHRSTQELELNLDPTAVLENLVIRLGQRLVRSDLPGA